MVYVNLTKIKNVDVAVAKLTNCGCLEIDNRYKETKITPICKPKSMVKITPNS